MGLSATVYAEQLSTYGHGHPLWYPEPTKGLDGCVRDAQLGDVGYIDEDGSFRRLFNVTVGAEHELNAGGVPDGFVPLNFNEKLITVKEQFLAPGPLCSRSVKGRAAEATASTNVCGAGGGGLSYNFHCTSDRGALLLLKDYATKTSISSNPHFPEYMRRHHESWYRFATDPEKLGIECMPEDIILVRGTTKTSAWTVAAFLFKIDRVHGLAVEAQLGPAASFGLTLSSEHGIYPTCEQRSGPYGTDTGSSISPRSSQEPLKDQCVFLNHYKIKYRKFFPTKIVARADHFFTDGRQDDSEGDTVVATEVDVETETIHNPPRSPLDDVLDYILSHSDADAAIASYEDLECLFPERDFEMPLSLADILRERKPSIIVDKSKTGRLDITHGCSESHVAITYSSEDATRPLHSPGAYSRNRSQPLSRDTSLRTTPRHPQSASTSTPRSHSPSVSRHRHNSAVPNAEWQGFGTESISDSDQPWVECQNEIPCDRCIPCVNCTRTEEEVNCVDGSETKSRQRDPYAIKSNRTEAHVGFSNDSSASVLTRSIPSANSLSSYIRDISATGVQSSAVQLLSPSDLIEIPQRPNLYRPIVERDQPTPTEYWMYNYTDDEMLQGFGKKSIPRVTTRAQVAVDIADVMKEFIDYAQNVSTTEPYWDVSPRGRIRFEDVYLLEVRQVAVDDLQPVLAYGPRNPRSQPI